MRKSSGISTNGEVVGELELLVVARLGEGDGTAGTFFQLAERAMEVDCIDH